MNKCLVAVFTALLCQLCHFSKCVGAQPRQSQCTLSNRSNKFSPSSKEDAMLSLLDSQLMVETFFESHFEHAYMHISHSKRANRLSWMQHYRRFLPSADLDLILSYNASSLNFASPLILHEDVNIFRVVEREPDLYTWMPISVPVQLDSLRAAVRDGGVLQLNYMSSRSRRVADFTDSLRNYWAVPVSASLCFYPPKTTTEPSPAPSFSATDIFVVFLHGKAIVDLFEDFFPFPCDHHVESLSVRRAAQKDLVTPKVVQMDEGDVLYIPRGMGFDIRTSDSLAISIKFEIHTDHRLVFHALEHAVNITRRTSDILDAFVSPVDMDGSKSSVTWAEVFTTAVKMAAEFTPAMRRFIPVTGNVLSMMDEVGVEVGETLLQDSLRRFSRAGRSALFEPMLDILTSNDKSVGAIAKTKLITWAKQMKNKGNNEIRKSKRLFLAGIKDISRISASPSDVITSLSLEWYDAEERERSLELQFREQILMRHGQNGTA